MIREDYVWALKYRPRTIEDCILPEDLKQTFRSFVEQNNVPNLLLAGSAGSGKTTVARAMLEQIGADVLEINGSMNGNIDTLRNEIMQFASTVSFTSHRKFVILDEADYLNPNSTQPALRNFMEEFSKNCGFILTCNFKNRIIEPLHSRCSVIDFKIDKAEMPTLAGQFFKRVRKILDTEGIEYDKAVVAELISKHAPDWRRILNELQMYSATGKINAGMLTSLSEESYKDLVKYLKAKNFPEMRKWVAENTDIDSSTLFRKLYDSAHTFLKPGSIPQLVLILADYQYKAAFVADHEINNVAALTQVMVDVEFI